MIEGRSSAATLASGKCSQNIEPAMAPGWNEVTDGMPLGAVRTK